MSPLELALALAAFVIGLTGTWSPCGFSMIETIGPTGHTGGRPTTLAACATFLPGALAGAVLTFGALAGLGGLFHGAGGRAAYLVAAAIALVAAFAEARGVPIVPQIRRQLPEHWRRVMPMPVAAALYGVLLGLGLTTFVLSFGVWALAGVSLAVGDLGAALAIGIGFGLGRAVPIVTLAPAAGSRFGTHVMELMAGRPSIYRGFRFGDALALALAAIALGTSAGSAGAAQTVVPNGADPSASESDFVYQRPDRTGVLIRDGEEILLSGTDPAVGGPYIAVISGQKVSLLARDTLEPVTELSLGGVDAVAISGEWLVTRRREEGRDVLEATDITDPLDPGPPQRITSTSSPSQVGRPAIDGDVVVWATAQRDQSRVWKRDLGDNKNKVVAGARFYLLTSPAIEGGRIIYVRSGSSRDAVMTKKLSQHGNGRPIYNDNGPGILWSTALEGGRAYVTVLNGDGIEIISVD